MQIADYFDFLANNDIRIKGTRIGIETILYEYIYRCRTPEEIAKTYTSLTLEQVYATVLYYWHRHDDISQYLKTWLEYCLQAEQAQKQNPSPFVKQLMQLKAERQSTVSIEQSADHEVSA